MKTILLFTMLAILTAPAHAAGFKSKFLNTCKSEGYEAKECSCQYRKLSKPKTSAEQRLVTAVQKTQDTRVKLLIIRVGPTRATKIINSMTSGLVSC